MRCATSAGIAGRQVVAVVSGGNFDFERLPEVKERAQRYRAQEVPDPAAAAAAGGAARLPGLLGPDDDIARFEYLKKSARNFGSVLIGIEARRTRKLRHARGAHDRRRFAWLDITDDAVITNLIV